MHVLDLQLLLKSSSVFKLLVSYKWGLGWVGPCKRGLGLGEEAEGGSFKLGWAEIVKKEICKRNLQVQSRFELGLCLISKDVVIA